MVPDITPLPENPRCRVEAELGERQRAGLQRDLRLWEKMDGWINLADNDYLDLSRDPDVVAAAAAAAARYGCSSSASPLICGYQPPHRELEEALCQWHGFPSGLVWNSGFSANQAVLSSLPRRGDLVLADRLVHHSMIAGILRSGARLIRFRHNDTAHLRELLQRHAPERRTMFVVTESVYSMDGDSPALLEIAELREKFGFRWVLDEAHAIGWYGPRGSGLAAEEGVSGGVDVLVGTLGKALGSQGAYTLFNDTRLRSYFVNTSGEFIFSTYLAPPAAAAARAAIRRVCELSTEQVGWRKFSRAFRLRLREIGFAGQDGDSPIVPVVIGDASRALEAAAALREERILCAAVRPPTVPAKTSRLRLSLRRGMNISSVDLVMRALAKWRAAAADAQPR